MQYQANALVGNMLAKIRGGGGGSVTDLVVFTHYKPYMLSYIAI